MPSEFAGQNHGLIVVGQICSFPFVRTNIGQIFVGQNDSEYQGLLLCVVQVFVEQN